MTIIAINQSTNNNNNNKIHRPYIESNEIITTEQYKKADKPKGHLVNDRLASMPKFFFKDIAYDFKAVKDGIKGNANDHQLGRINDVGLKLGGISIATILASKTSNPMARFMEYLGLGAFLASMNLYPKLAIQLPSRKLHGFDSGLEYIDDQGRKKSVFQDSNYIPFDMYNGDTPAEDLNIIGDRMGIPRDIKNRNDLIKEQMRKIATQNNTLWMLTAGLATPVMTALICSGLEKPISNMMMHIRNLDYNYAIKRSLIHTENMTENLSDIPDNKLSKKIINIIEPLKNKEISKQDLKLIETHLVEGLDNKISEAIKTDLKQLLKTSKNSEVSFLVNEEFTNTILNNIKKEIPRNQKAKMEQVFNISEHNLLTIIKSFNKEQLTENDLELLKQKLNNIFEENIKKQSNPKFYRAKKNIILDNITKNIRKQESNFLSENAYNDLVNLSKAIGEFKHNSKILDKCKHFKVEHANETILAKSYANFEKTLFKVLDIGYKDMKYMRESEDISLEIIDKKLKALTSDKTKYEKAITKLANAMQKMENDLNGTKESSKLFDLITAIENNYNTTAKRINKIGSFSNVVDMLVKEDVSTLTKSITSKEELQKMLTGMKENPFKDFNYWGDAGEAGRINYAKQNAKGLGSSKNEVISRIIERYQGVHNSFNRILHTLDVYNRPENLDDYGKTILERSKQILVNATSSDHALKLNTVNNPTLYKDIMYTTWNKENLTENTKKALKESSENILNSFNAYLDRFKTLIGNYDIDFTKPNHNLNMGELANYDKSAQTRMSRFNLIAQKPLDFIKNAADRRYNSQKWFRTVSIFGAATLAVTLLAQLKFGKIKNQQNIQKQVSDDSNK